MLFGIGDGLLGIVVQLVGDPSGFAGEHVDLAAIATRVGGVVQT